MMRLVVLDDDAATTEFMATIARRRGWRSTSVDAAKCVPDLVDNAPPDAIMLDLQLGDSDGIEQLRFLHTCNYRGNIVLMSGFDARVLASAQRDWQLARSVGRSSDRKADAHRAHRAGRSAIEQTPAKAPVAPRPKLHRPRARSRRTTSARRLRPVRWRCICNRSSAPVARWSVPRL